MPGSQTQPLTRFHLFPRLPPEIQLMIWDFYHDMAPVLRHCFVEGEDDLSLYYAFDQKSKRFVDTRTTEETSVIPDQMVFDLGRVQLYDLSNKKSCPIVPGPRVVGPIHCVRVSADVVRDVFVFRRTSFASVMRRIEKALGPCGSASTSTLASCWTLSVQKLAMDVTSLAHEVFPYEILTRFKKLRVVYLIVDWLSVQTYLKQATLEAHGAYRFRDGPGIRGHTGFIPLSQYCELTNWPVAPFPPADAFQMELEALFRENDMKVQVQQVMDIF